MVSPASAQAKAARAAAQAGRAGSPAPAASRLERRGEEQRGERRADRAAGDGDVERAERVDRRLQQPLDGEDRRDAEPQPLDQRGGAVAQVDEPPVGAAGRQQPVRRARWRSPAAEARRARRRARPAREDRKCRRRRARRRRRRARPAARRRAPRRPRGGRARGGSGRGAGVGIAGDDATGDPVERRRERDDRQHHREEAEPLRQAEAGGQAAQPVAEPRRRARSRRPAPRAPDRSTAAGSPRSTIARRSRG